MLLTTSLDVTQLSKNNLVRYFKLFVWRNGQFEELGEELGIPDVAKTVAWAGDSLCVGFRREYYLIKVSEKNCLEI